MRTIDDYISAALTRQNLTSRRELSRKLDLNATFINQVEKRGVLPSDETMVKLARLAGMDETEALIHLNTWRSTGQAANIYRDLLKRVSAAVIISGVSIATFSAADPARAQVSGENQNTVYYGKYLPDIKT